MEDKMTTKWLWTAILVCCMVLAGAGVSYGQNGSPKVIHTVLVEGNTQASSSVILRPVKSRAGAVLNEELVEEDAKRIIVLPEVRNVRWRIEDTDVIANGVNVVFTVEEAEVIQSVELVGNKAFKTEKLTALLGFGENDFLDRYLVTRGAEDIRDYYLDKGYYFVKVDLNQSLLSSEGRVVYVIVEGPKLRIKKIRFEGNSHIRSGKLKSQLGTKTYFPIFSKGRLEDLQVEQDVQNLTRYYNDQGFLDAQVFARKDFNVERTRLEIMFVIDEGPRYKVKGVSFRGNEHYDEGTLRGALVDVAEGVYYKHRDIAKSQREIGYVYGRDGYIYTRVNVLKEYTETPGEVNLVFDIDEGEPFGLGRVIVKGNYKTKDKVVRRTFDRHGFLPGGIYNTEAVDKGKTRIRGEGLFEQLEVTPIGDSPDERDALVEVVEANTGMIILGAGVDTNSGLVGQISVEQRNFDIGRPATSLKDLFSGRAWTGSGQRMRLEFSPGTRVTTARLNFRDPYLFDQPNYLDLNLFLYRRYRESYLEKRSGGSMTLGRRFENDWSIDITGRAEVVNVSDLDMGRLIPGDNTSARIVVAPPEVEAVEGDNLITSLKLGMGRDTTDSMFRPSDGYKLHSGYEQVLEPISDFDYGMASAGISVYHTLYEDITERKTILSGRLDGKQIVYGDAPVFERYYAGGIGTIRGFEYRGVSPRNGRHRDPIGSDYMVLAGLEFTYPMYEETLFGKFFCDSGIVSDGPYRVSLGWGFDLMIPQMFQMIPMSFNFAVPVVEDEEDDDQLFSFSLGVSF